MRKTIKNVCIFLVVVSTLFLLMFQFACDNSKIDMGGIRYLLSEDKTYYSVSTLTENDSNIVEIQNEINNLPVKKILPNAFKNGKKLTSIFINSNMENIADGVFEDCDKLSFISVAENNQNFSSKTGILYNKDKTELVYVPNLVSGEIILPKSISCINAEIFKNKKTIKTVAFENGSELQTIGFSAFEGCENLETIKIPNSLTSIGGRAFAGCSNLSSVNLENADNLLNIGVRAFAECKSLKSIVLPSNLTEISEGLFFKCENLSNVTFPTVDFSVKEKAFWKCGFEKVNITENFVAIESGAFSLNYNLTEFIADGNANFKVVDGDLYSKDGKTFMFYALKKSISPNVNETFTISSAVNKILPYAFYDEDGKMTLKNIYLEGAIGWKYNGKNAQYLVNDSRDVAGLFRYSFAEGTWSR